MMRYIAMRDREQHSQNLFRRKYCNGVFEWTQYQKEITKTVNLMTERKPDTYVGMK